MKTLPDVMAEREVANDIDKTRDQPSTYIPNDPQRRDAATSEESADSDRSEHSSSIFDSRSPQSSATASVPPRAEEFDRTLRHIGLKDFGKALDSAAKAVFPNDKKSRYSRVYVLLICWKTQDPMLPVQREIIALRKVLEELYHYEIEEFQIPDHESHAGVSEKINAFVKVDNNSCSDLKIVYYAGHSRLSRTKELVWSTLSEKNLKSPVVMWSGIQRSLEMAYSDVLILLDCCSSGVANDSEGNGITELICACPFDTEANGVGHYSFTQALTTELRILSSTPCFSVGELYNSIYTRMQSYLPQGVENERYPPPVHFVLTQDKNFGRGIKLSTLDSKISDHDHTENGRLKRVRFQDTHDMEGPRGSEPPHAPNKRFCLGESSSSRMEAVVRPWIERAGTHRNADDYNTVPGEFQDGSTCQAPDATPTAKQSEGQSRLPIPKNFMDLQDAPRALFAVRFREDVRGEDLVVELFKEWFRSIPAAVEEVFVEAGFKCFSTLLLITVPLSMSSYIPQHPAIFPLGAVKSSIILPLKGRDNCLLGNKEFENKIRSPDGINEKRKVVSSMDFLEQEFPSDERYSYPNGENSVIPQFNLAESTNNNEMLPNHPNPDLGETNQEVPEFEVSEPATIYVRNILDKFPEADLRLVQRLGEANWQRHIKVRDRNEVSKISVEICAAKSVFHDSGFGSSIPTASCYAPSASSFVSKVGDADREYFRVPPTPKEVFDDEPFDCFICGRLLVHIRNRVDWKMHVFADIRPYICTVSSCKDALRTFASRNELADHEFTVHWGSAQSAVTSYRSGILRENLDESDSVSPDKHGAKDALHPISILMRSFLFCPLCQSNLGASKQNYISHVAKHMESIALAALPPDPDEISDNDSGESVQDVKEIHALGGKQRKIRSREKKVGEEDDNSSVSGSIRSKLQNGDLTPFRDTTAANGGKAGAAPDVNAVWNNNRPAPPPEPKRFTDEEPNQRYGIHLATRLQSDDPGKRANWADIDDDDDDWAPESIEWTDGTKITLPQADEAPAPSPEPTPAATFKDGKVMETAKPKSLAPTQASASPTVKPSGFGGKARLVLKGASEKPTLVAKPPGPPTPVKSPWVSLPPVDR